MDREQVKLGARVQVLPYEDRIPGVGTIVNIREDGDHVDVLLDEPLGIGDDTYSAIHITELEYLHKSELTG